MDYNSGPYTATITAGTDRASFNIPLNDDNIVEGNENFMVIIDMSSLPNDFVLGTISQATVTIRDEDSKSAISDVDYCHCFYTLSCLMLWCIVRIYIQHLIFKPTIRYSVFIFIR